MNVRDCVTVLLALAGAVGVIAPLPRLRRGWLWLATGLLAAEQLWAMGPHWQMLPAFAALALDCVLMGRGFSRARAAAAVLAAGLALASLALIWVLPVFKLPQPAGMATVGTQTIYVIDPQTERELAVQLWYPAGQTRGLARARYSRIEETKPQFAYWWGVRTNSWQDAPVAAGAHPVIVFGPMWGGRRTQDTFLAEELASHGYVVAALDHPGNAARMERSDGTVVKGTMAGALSNVEASSAAALEALWAKELAVWVRDDAAVLDWLAEANGESGGWLSGRLDMDRVGALGHSFGGAAAMALLGKDARVRCAVNLDGWTFNGLATRTAGPVLFVYEGSAQVRRPAVGVEGELDRDDNAAVDASLQKYGGLRAYVAGTQHMDFTDQTLVSPWQRLTYTGPIKGDRVRTIVRGMVLGFFDRELTGTGGVPSFPEVTVERFGGGG